MNVEQPLNGLTWGELRDFVALGDQFSDTEEVDFDYDDVLERQSMFIIGIKVVRDGS